MKKSIELLNKAERLGIKEDFGIDIKDKLYFQYPLGLLIIPSKQFERDWKKIKWGKISIGVFMFICNTIFSIFISIVLMFFLPFSILFEFLDYKSGKKKK